MLLVAGQPFPSVAIQVLDSDNAVLNGESGRQIMVMLFQETMIDSGEPPAEEGEEPPQIPQRRLVGLGDAAEWTKKALKYELRMVIEDGEFKFGGEDFAIPQTTVPGEYRLAVEDVSMHGGWDVETPRVFGAPSHHLTTGSRLRGESGGSDVAPVEGASFFFVVLCANHFLFLAWI